MLAPALAPQRLGHPHAGLLGIHGDFFQNHAAFGFDVRRPQRRAHQLGEGVQQICGALGQSGGVVDGGFLGSKSVRLPAEVVEALRELKIRIPEDVALVCFEDVELASALNPETVPEPLRLLVERLR